ncbi:hypothetical protein ACFOEK_06925 [Litoribrevibacter euphylliae]|uniref:Uncharacterized protein n=1 Tax=Litoribrevibacter euphylliae TaxID=1834034 RepID=A0ABV7HA07_9GAMM
MFWILFLLIGEITKIIKLKTQKYFTPVRILGMLSILIGLYFRQISTNSTQMTIVGGLLMGGLLMYTLGWDRKRNPKDK